MASASSQAGFLAKQGLSFLYSATVTGVNAVSTGISKACKHYADLHEREKIESMRKAGKRPEDVIFAALQRLLHLEMAGYHHEVAAVSQKIASKLGTADDRSSVEHQTLQALSRTLVEACRQHGMDVTPSVKGGRLGFQGLEDFLNSSRMGTDHYDRDKLVTDLYFAFLFAQDIAQGNIQRIEAAFNEAVERLISGPARDCLSPVSPLSPASTGSAPSPGKSVGGFSSGCVRAASANDLPAYARPDAFKLPQAPPKPTSFFSATTTTSSSSSSSNGGKWGSSPSPASGQAGNKPAPLVGIGTEDDKTSGGLLVLKRLACCVARAAAEAEARRQRGLLDAQEVVRREQEKASTAAAMAGGGASGAAGLGGAGVGGAGVVRGMPMGGGRPIPAATGGGAPGAWGSASASPLSVGSVGGPPAARAAAVSNWKGGSCSAVPGDASIGAYGGGMGGVPGKVGGGAGGYGASVGGSKVVGGVGKSGGGGWGGGKSGGGWLDSKQ